MIKNFTIASICLALSACASTLVEHKFAPTVSIDSTTYPNAQDAKGVVLLSVNWSRAWKCGGYENAELRSIGFDLLPTKQTSDEQSPDFVINGSPSHPDYTNYAFQLMPGEYALSHIQIKVAKSASDVGYLNSPRSKLILGGTSEGGSFTVDSSEVVYIGHFHLDCAYSPILWRYYIETKDEFQNYINSFANHYNFLNTDNARYRLFKTNTFGKDFKL